MSGSWGQAQPPWLLWGQTQQFTVQPAVIGAGAVPNQNTTLARASYGRPDTWRFLLHAVFLSGGEATAVGESALVEVNFDLFLGMGRSAIKIPNFVSLLWDWSGGFPPDSRHNQPLYVTTANGQISIPGPVPAEVRLIDQFVAQDVTVVASVFHFTDVPSPLPVVVDVSAMLAPNTHVRPDWMQIDAPAGAQFPGGEVGGR